MQGGKVMCEEALQIVEERRKAKGKGGKGKLNAEFQRQQEKKAFLKKKKKKNNAKKQRKATELERLEIFSRKEISREYFM